MILFTADLHIKLGQRNVPVEWQYNRFMMLADKLNKIADEQGVTEIIIAGDLLDVANPSIDELGLMYDFLAELDRPKRLIAGNHEMKTKSLDCFKVIQNMLEDLNVTYYEEFVNLRGIDYIPYNVLKDKNWPDTGAKVAVTHVRGEIPPHVEPEIPLERFDKYDKVFAGDLHSYKNSQRNIFYPGSPMVTSFHREPTKGSNGIFIIDPETFEHEWIELGLPQLIRKKVSSEEEIVKTEYHHTIYEVEGDLESLSGIKKSELLDKKVVKDISTPATLNMSGDVVEELQEYLINVKGIKDPSRLITAFKELL
jgi:DNA repair exonuclease SbcCD nuclease subunit